jgi:hypothetical protein
MTVSDEILSGFVLLFVVSSSTPSLDVLALATKYKLVNTVKLVVETYIKFHEIDILQLAAYQKLKHAPKSTKKKDEEDKSTVKEDDSEKKEQTRELPSIDKTKKKELKKFLTSSVTNSITLKCRDMAEYFFSVYDFQLLQRYSPLGVRFSVISSQPLKRFRVQSMPMPLILWITFCK